MKSDNKFRKYLAILGSMCAAFALASCCHEECERSHVGDWDIAYNFNIPSNQDDCPDPTLFCDIDGDCDRSGIDDLGGSGIIDRGGSGIIDREGQGVKKFCYKPCPAGEEPVGKNVYPIWNYGKEYIVTESNCAIPEPETVE